jgi:prepilin-type N-terminal cleavage/methylation domain-containing protein
MSKHARKGFSLLEMTAVLMLVGIVLVFSATIFHGGFRIERANSAAFRRLMHEHELADRFRADVAETIATPEVWGDFEAGWACLILQKRDRHHVAYYQGRDKRLKRFEQDGDRETDATLPLGDGPLVLEFLRDGRLVTLRIEEARKPALPLVRHIAAALPRGVK